jgi:glycosyltransferase involved in cell wall biosynthesis
VIADDAHAARLRVLRMCSVFEPPDAALAGRAVKFDPVGGMQSHTGQLTRALDALGVRHDVVTHRPPGAPHRHRVGAEAVVHRVGLPVHWARQLYSVPAAVAAWRLAPRADLVHAHLGEDLAILPIALRAARRAAIPLVVTVHCSLRHTFAGPGARGWLLRTAGGRIEAAVTQRADMVIALTPRLAARIGADGVPPERVHVIGSGVTAARFAGDAPDPFPAMGRPRIVYVGRLVRQKGVETLVEAAALMRTQGAQVLLVGDGPHRRTIETAIRRLGLADRVRITGFRPHSEIPAVLRHADLFCLPSRYEELGSALIEAMQAALPIVASDVGGIPEALGPAGRLVPAGDPTALAAALDALLSEPAEAARLSGLARERAHAWDWDRLAAQVLDVYRGALEGHAGRGTPAAEPRHPPASTGEQAGPLEAQR